MALLINKECSSSCKDLNVILINRDENIINISESVLGLFGQNCQNFNIFIINLYSNNEGMHKLNEFLSIYPESFINRVKFVIY